MRYDTDVSGHRRVKIPKSSDMFESMADQPSDGPSDDAQGEAGRPWWERWPWIPVVRRRDGNLYACTPFGDVLIQRGSAPRKPEDDPKPAA
jgi:hypothetical protein